MAAQLPVPRSTSLRAQLSGRLVALHAVSGWFHEVKLSCLGPMCLAGTRCWIARSDGMVTGLAEELLGHGKSDSTLVKHVSARQT
jgi:hypothetical protein